MTELVGNMTTDNFCFVFFFNSAVIVIIEIQNQMGQAEFHQERHSFLVDGPAPVYIYIYLITQYFVTRETNLDVA